MKKINKIIFIVLLVFLLSPKVNAYSLNCNNTYSYGSRGENVKILQMKLNIKAACGINVDGIFGNKTKECVKKYQKKYNLEVDGIVGKKTCNSLNGVTVPSEEEKPSSPNNYEELPESTLSVKYLVTGNKVNFRKGPSTRTASYGLLSKNTEVFVLEKKNNNWYKVEYNNKIGYISAKYLTEKVDSPLQSNEYIVLPTSVNIRSGASTSSRILGTVSRGTKVTVTGIKNNWYKVYVNYVVGYIRSDYLTRNIIIVDISDQMLYYFKGDKSVLTAPVITGRQGKHDTPTGDYTLYTSNKGRNRYLKGYNDDGTKYKSYVNYWMPFNGGVGFHDATWRSTSTFNKTTYLTNGSHGCINMKYRDAKTLYNNTTTNTAVIIKE